MKTSLKDLRKKIVIAASRSGEGHIPSAFSILDILWILYHRVMKVDPLKPKAETRDRFILSKGHASLGLYAVLAERGFFSIDEIDSFGKSNSRLGGHADRNKVPGVEASTGSLGHGFPMAVGMALGLKIKKRSERVFCIVGDGESNEGTVWESALLAAHHKLSNLICIVDYNHSTDRALLMGDLAKKFEAFGWDTVSINGHDHDQLFKELSSTSNKPKAIIAETIKGFGCKRMESNPAWHHASPKENELDEILAEIT